MDVPAFSFVLTEPRVVWTYLRLFLCPVGQSVDHDLALSRSLFYPPSTLPALLGMSALVGTLIWLAWRGNRPAFWGLGFFVLLAPTSSIVPVRDVMFEHRVYFPLMCLVIAAAWLLAFMPRHVLLPIAVTLLIALLAGTIGRNRAWHDEKSLWTDAMRRSQWNDAMGKSPHKARQYAARARALMAGDPDLACQLLEHALTLDPNDPKINNDLGVGLLLKGDAGDALEHLEKAIAQGGETPDYLTNLGMALRVLGQLDRAIESFRRALEIDPCKEEARENLMRALVYRGNKLEAFAAGEVPADCHLLPDEAQKLEEYKQSLR